MHFFYKSDSEYIDLWKDFQPNATKFLTFFSEKIGKYPYAQYSVIMAETEEWNTQCVLLLMVLDTLQ